MPLKQHLIFSQNGFLNDKFLVKYGKSEFPEGFVIRLLEIISE